MRRRKVGEAVERSVNIKIYIYIYIQKNYNKIRKKEKIMI